MSATERAAKCMQGILSYPFFDPVLTDRAFLASPKAMLISFILAGFISGTFIFLFAFTGIFGNMVATLQPTTWVATSANACSAICYGHASHVACNPSQELVMLDAQPSRLLLPAVCLLVGQICRRMMHAMHA